MTTWNVWWCEIGSTILFKTWIPEGQKVLFHIIMDFSNHKGILGWAETLCLQGTLNYTLDHGNLLCRIKNEIGSFLLNSLNNPNIRKWPYLINYYGFATMSHGCKGYFPSATMTDNWKNVYFREFFKNKIHILGL